MDLSDPTTSQYKATGTTGVPGPWAPEAGGVHTRPGLRYRLTPAHIDLIAAAELG